MGAEQRDWAGILADMEAKRSALETAIGSLRVAIAMGALGQVGEIPPMTNLPAGATFANPYSLSGSEVPAGAFFGKSIPEAAKLYLEIIKKKQTSKDIAEALKNGGMESNAKNFQQMVHSVLDRARKSGTGIVKLDRSHWGLAAWYPAGLRSTVVPGKRNARKKLRKDGKQKPVSRASPPAKEGSNANERALEYLQKDARGERSLASIAAQIGVGERGTRLILGKLVKAGKLRMSAPGMYTASPWPPAPAVN